MSEREKVYFFVGVLALAVALTVLVRVFDPDYVDCFRSPGACAYGITIPR